MKLDAENNATQPPMSLQADLARCMGDNERLLKALGAETVEDAIGAVWKLKEGVMIEKVKALRPRPGEIVVLTLPEGATREDADTWVGILRGVFPSDTNLLIEVSGSASFEVRAS